MKGLLKKGAAILMLGTGGVGKTTVASALGLAAAARYNTALITVDPSQRLRDALGLAHLGGEPRRLGADLMRAAGLDSWVGLSAMVLDPKGAWDGLIEKLAASDETRRRILDNPFYRNLTEQFAGSESFAALERLYDLHTSRIFDLEIVDTPPAAHALEFLQAPARLTRLLDSTAARRLFAPYTLTAGRFAMKVASHAAQFVVRELERYAGANVLSSIAEFFAAAADTAAVVAERFHKTEALLHSPGVHFVLVTTPEEDRLHQARRLIDEMKAVGLRLSAIVINRFLDEKTWHEMGKNPAQTPEHFKEIMKLRGLLNHSLARDHGLDALVGHLEDYGARVMDEIARVADFAREISPKVTLAVAPEMHSGVRSLRGLARVARFLSDSEAKMHLLKIHLMLRRSHLGTASERAASAAHRG